MLGEVIEDEQPAPISVEAAFARLWQIRTIKSVILAFAAIGFGLFTTGVLANLFMEQEYGTETLERGVLGTIGGLGLLVALPFVGSLLRPSVPERPDQGAPPRRLPDPARRRAHAGRVLHAQRRSCSCSSASRERSCCSPRSPWSGR